MGSVNRLSLGWRQERPTTNNGLESLSQSGHLVVPTEQERSKEIRKNYYGNNTTSPSQFLSLCGNSADVSALRWMPTVTSHLWVWSLQVFVGQDALFRGRDHSEHIEKAWKSNWRSIKYYEDEEITRTLGSYHWWDELCHSSWLDLTALVERVNDGSQLGGLGSGLPDIEQRTSLYETFLKISTSTLLFWSDSQKQTKWLRLWWKSWLS